MSADDSEFLFTMPHFDDDSPSQEMSAPRVLERTALAASLPVIMVGDFVSRTDDLAYPTLVEQFVDATATSTPRLRTTLRSASTP